MLEKKINKTNKTRNYSIFLLQHIQLVRHQDNSPEASTCEAGAGQSGL